MKTNYFNTIPTIAAALCACSISCWAAEKPLASLKFSHPRNITNPFLPLARLDQDILEGKEGSNTLRVERTLKPDIHKTFKIGEKTVESLAMEDREFKNGTLAEVTIDYFAQADDGTVLYLGEDVDEYKDGKISGHEGAWMLGKDTQTPGVMMPGRPKVGVKFKSEDVNKEIHEDDEVISTSETVTVPAGTFKNCLKVKEVLAEGEVETKYFAFGIGCVREILVDGDIRLKSHKARTVKAVAEQGNNQPNAAAPGAGKQKVFADPMAREALAMVGMNEGAEMYWFDAIHDASLPLSERQDLIDDLNENGISDWKHPSAEDLPIIMNRLKALEALVPTLPEGLEWKESRDDLINLGKLAGGFKGAQPVQ